MKHNKWNVPHVPLYANKGINDEDNEDSAKDNEDNGHRENEVVNDESFDPFTLSTEHE